MVKFVIYQAVSNYVITIECGPKSLAFFLLPNCTYLHVYMKRTDYFYSFWAMRCVQSLAYKMEEQREVVRFSVGSIIFNTVFKINVRRIPYPKQ